MKYAFLFFISVQLFSCAESNSGEKTVTPAFYHWKSGFDLSPAGFNYLETLAVKKIYLRFFDVDWNGELQKPLPVGEVTMPTDGQRAFFEWIPTVFITNRTFLHLNPGNTEFLADSILFKISTMMPDRCFSEIQIDCDWSGKTKDVYFQFLKNLKTKMKDKLLSVTIRLHQVKYHRITGIPPADNGVLMFYNMSPVEQWETENSILNILEGKKYMYNFEEYTLPLDLVLPLFRWGVLFRKGKMIKLINDLGPEELADSSRFQKIEPNRFKVTKSTYLNGYYLYRDDLIRLEGVEWEDLLQSAELLDDYMVRKNLTVAFYHLDETVNSRVPIKEIQHVIQKFKE